jgi:hypothetical protein
MITPHIIKKSSHNSSNNFLPIILKKESISHSPKTPHPNSIELLNDSINSHHTIFPIISKVVLDKQTNINSII